MISAYSHVIFHQSWLQTTATDWLKEFTEIILGSFHNDEKSGEQDDTKTGMQPIGIQTQLRSCHR